MTRPARRRPEAVGASAGPARTGAPCGPALMRVFTEVGAYDEARFPETSRVKRRLRETEEGREDMGSVIEEIRAECIAEGIETGRAEGIAEGEVRGTLKTLGRLVRDGLVSVQDAAASAGVDADEIRRTLAQGSARTAPAPGRVRA